MSDRELFIAALERDDHDRRGWLDQACGGDRDRRRRLDVLLRAHEMASQFLASPGGDHTRSADPAKTGQPDAPPDLLSLLAPAEKPGQLGKLGHYEVLEVVGQGGMGVVVRAYDPKLHRVVAIKLLAPHLAANTCARLRFEREARAVAAVRNEHVVAIYDVETSGPSPYLVMEFIGGTSLQERLDKRGPLEVKEILRIGIQAARGLAAAHEQGLVHRDVKPANILLENGVERVKITDFGLARAVDDASVTQSGVIAGTPLFMSPEQADGKPFDPRSDLFSLGSVLYALCTGHAPFRASGTMAVLKRVTEDTPRPIRESGRDTPDWLEAIVAKLLAKKPEQRFQSADEVAELLGQHLAHLQRPNEVARPAPVLVHAGLPAPERNRAFERAAMLLVALGILSPLADLGISSAESYFRTVSVWLAGLNCVSGFGAVVTSWRDAKRRAQPRGTAHSLAMFCFLMGLPGAVFAVLLANSTYRDSWELPVVLLAGTIVLVGSVLLSAGVVPRRPAPAEPPVTPRPAGSRWRNVGNGAATLIGLALLLLVLNRAGVVTFGGIAERLFYHRVVVRAKDRGVVVRVWKTKDEVEAANRFSFILEGPDFHEPFRTTVLTGEKTLRLPPGNYWLLADKGEKRVYSELLRVGWGGTRSIAIAPERPNAGPGNPSEPAR